MIFDITKIHYYRKKKGLSISEFCKLINIGRSTLWRWEREQTEPSGEVIEKIAEVLDVSIGKLQNMRNDLYLNDKLYFEEDIWKNIPTNSTDLYKYKMHEIVKKVLEINSSLESLLVLMSGILDNEDIIFYAKNSELQYIVANKAFLNNLNIKESYSVFGKDDEDFFNKFEAKINREQDVEVLKSGKALINTEQFIVGSKKKKWGLVSKTPIYNSNGKGLGVIGFIMDITEKKRDEKINDILAKALGKTEYNVSIRDYKEKKCLFITDNISTVLMDTYENIEKANIEERAEKRIYKADRENFLNLVADLTSKKIEKVETIVREYGEHTNYRIRWMKLYYKSFNVLKKNYYLRISKDITGEMQEQLKLINANIIIDNLKNTVVFLAELDENEGKQELKHILVGDNVENITGYSQEYFYDNKTPITKILTEESKDIFNNYKYDENVSFEYDVKIKKRDGSIVRCNLKLNDFTKDNKKYLSIILTDIEEEKKLYEELEEYRSLNAEIQINEKVKQIAVKFKRNNVANEIIAESTGLSIKEIEKL